MANPKLTNMVNDNDFLSLPPADQRRALSMLTNDNSFNSLSDGETLQFISGVKNPELFQTADPTAMANKELAKSGLSVSPPANRLPQIQQAGPVSRFLTSAAQPFLGTDASLSNKSYRQNIDQALSGKGTGLPFGTPESAASAVTEPAKQISSGDVAGGVGSYAGLAAQLYLTKKAAEKASPVGQYSKPQAVNDIVNAINPAAEDMPKMRTDLANHLDDILAYAKDNKIPVSRGVSGLAEATQKTAQAAHDFYYQKMLKPIADAQVSVPKEYQGAASSAGEYSANRTATLGQINARLTEINNTLYPKYAKGGVAAQAAVGADQAGALRAEASTLRDLLNNEMARRLDMAPAQVAEVRNRMGTLRQLGEDIQYYADKSLKQANDLRNAGYRPDAHVTGIAAQKAQAGFRGMFGTPADRLVSSVVSRYSPTPSPAPSPTVLDVLKSPRGR